MADPRFVKSHERWCCLGIVLLGLLGIALLAWLSEVVIDGYGAIRRYFGNHSRADTGDFSREES